jgi:hypothetical protein
MARLYSNASAISSSICPLNLLAARERHLTYELIYKLTYKLTCKLGLP